MTWNECKPNVKVKIRSTGEIGVIRGKKRAEIIVAVANPNGVGTREVRVWPRDLRSI